MLRETDIPPFQAKVVGPSTRAPGLAPYRRTLHDCTLVQIEDYSISRRQPPAAGYSPEHQIALAYRGGFGWRVGGDEADVSSGDVLLVQGGKQFSESHLYDDVGHASVLITPSESLLDEFDRMRRPMRGAFDRSVRPGNVTTTLATYALLSRLGGSATSFSLFAEETVAWLFEGVFCDDAGLAPTTRPGLVAEAKVLLHDKASVGLSLTDIAREVGASPAALAVSFRYAEHRTMDSYRRHVARIGTTSSKRPPRINRENLATVTRYVDRHYQDRCSLDILADLAGISRYQLIRAFAAVIGLTPAQYVIATRLRIAAADLATSGDPITDIALRVGFNDISHFNGSFRRAFGMSPRCWRSRFTKLEKQSAA